MEARDLERVVEVHLQSFPGFFLSFLGTAFLREFYRAFLDDPTGIAWIAEMSSGGQLVGVVVGPSQPDGFFSRLLRRRWLAFGWASLGAVLHRPAVLPRLCRALAYRGAPPPGSPRALLSSIAVLPASQGQGVGCALVTRWMDEARKRGSRGCFLTTDAADNEVVNRFYIRLGWTCEATYTTPEGRVMNRYVYDFMPP